jgi:hypothetical protein
MARNLISNVLAALVVLAAGNAAYAGNCCGVPTPPCGDCCYQPKIKYKTCYQTIVEERQVTCYKTVHRTVMKECRQVVCKPVWECVEKECRKVVCKPVWEEKCVPVCCGEWQCQQCFVPGKCVTRTCKVPVCNDGCNDCCGCGHKGFFHKRYEKVCYTEQLPGKCVTKKVWVPRTEYKTVRTCHMVKEEVCVKVPVKVCRMVQEEVVKCVPVCVCEKVPVCTTERVCRKVKVKVPVCQEEKCHGSLFGGLFHKKSCCEAPACGCGDATYGTAAPAATYAPGATYAPAPAATPAPAAIPVMPTPATK